MFQGCISFGDSSSQLENGQFERQLKRSVRMAFGKAEIPTWNAPSTEHKQRWDLIMSLMQIMPFNCLFISWFAFWSALIADFDFRDNADALVSFGQRVTHMCDTTRARKVNTSEYS